jgi:HEAT repeat protein
MTRFMLGKITCLLLAATLLGLVSMGVTHLVIHSEDEDQPTDVDRLIDQLREPRHKVHFVGGGMRGWEWLEYSPPMKKLIELGDEARVPLHHHLADERVRNEVVLILGSIGDDSTVPLLIADYPEPPLPNAPFDKANPDPGRLSIVCFSHSLCALTRQYFDRGENGTDFTPGNRKKWQDWWDKSHKVFWVEDRSPRPNRSLKAVPQILAQLDKALKDEDADVRKAAAASYSTLGPQAKDSVPNLIVAINDKDPKVRDAAARVFYFIGPDGQEAIPALIEAMRHGKGENVRGSAAIGLAKIGAAAIPQVLEALADDDAETRRLAAWSLGENDPKRKGLIPILQAASNDEDPDVRSYVLGSMEIIDSENPEVFKALLKGLDDPAPVVRRSCAWHFGRMGPRAQPATKELIALLQDKDAGVRRETLYAFDKIKSLTQEHVPVLIAALKDETWEVRSAAAGLLGKIGPGAKAAVDALCGTLSDPDPYVRKWAADVLGEIGPDAKPALPSLIKALADNDEKVRRNAEEALKKIDPSEAARAGIR